MYILLCGKQGSGKKTTMDQLRHYFSYRGQACYAYDYMQPVEQMHDAIYIVGKQYGLIKPDGVSIDQELLSNIVDWGNTHPFNWPGWAQCAKTHVDGITKRWDDLKMFYIGIIMGLPFVDDLKMFPNSFKVLLKCDRDERYERLTKISRSWVKDSHPIEVGFDDCAVCDIFDLVVDSGGKTPDEVAKEIGNSFHDKLLSGLREQKEPQKEEVPDNTAPPKTKK